MKRTYTTWCTGMALAAAMAASPVKAAPVAIDDLYVDTVSLSLNLTTPPVGTVLNTGDISVVPPVWIDMGAYQNPIVDGNLGSLYWKIYSTGMYGDPAPSGTADAAAGTIAVDLSSLRLYVSGIVSPSPLLPLPSTIDIELWPITSPPTSSTFDGATNEYSLSWVKSFSIDVWVDGLGSQTLEGNVDLTLSGALTTVPVPAAVWLFGSGLVGLAGVARRRKAA